MLLTEEQIVALAPDAASVSAGRGLAQPGKWVSYAHSDRALWGECQGSGKSPYRTQVDLAGMAFHCSCPSRKFPCKHGLGLMFLYARQPGSFATPSPPDWVTQWLNKRDAKDPPAAPAASPPVDEQAQAKRAEKRRQKVEDGVEELSRWISDLIRNGLASMPEQAPRILPALAARMVDAQAPGLAARVQALGEISFQQPGWPDRFLAGLLELHLLTEGYARLDSLPAPLQQAIRTRIGWAQPQEALRARTGTRDRWLIVARYTEAQPGMTVEKIWLHSQTTGQYALLLSFLFANQSPAHPGLVPGLVLDASLVFYDDAFPVRALLLEQYGLSKAVSGPGEGAAGWADAYGAFAACTAQNPFIEEFPIAVTGLTPIPASGQLLLADAAGAMVAVPLNRAAQTLLALSGGHPADLYLILRGPDWHLLATRIHGDFYPLHP